MKTFFKRSLPICINYNNKVYIRDGLNKTSNSIKVEVLSKRLEGVRDLHGNFYKPTVHYFNPV